MTCAHIYLQKMKVFMILLIILSGHIYVQLCLLCLPIYLDAIILCLTYGKCPKILYTKSRQMAGANRVDPDQAEGAV